jgi:hypothetical protein
MFIARVVVVAILHFVITFILGFTVGSTGSERSPLGVLVKILTFPLSVVKQPDNLHPLLGWGAWAAVSLAWGYAIVAGARYLSNR